MRLYRRIALTLANEGILGLSRRVSRKFASGRNHGVSSCNRPETDMPSGPAPSVEAMNETPPTVDEYMSLANDFFEKARSIGHENLEPYWWYHTVDLASRTSVREKHHSRHEGGLSNH